MSLKRQTFETDPSPGDERRVIPFRPRDSQKSAQPAGRRPVQPADLSRYERGRDSDDYRHRMIMNVVAGLFTVALTAFGIWLAMSIADLRKTTDCILVGRLDCATMPAHNR